MIITINLGAAGLSFVTALAIVLLWHFALWPLWFRFRCWWWFAS